MDEIEVYKKKMSFEISHLIFLFKNNLLMHTCQSLYSGVLKLYHIQGLTRIVLFFKFIKQLERG